ncbi:lysozyme inhibitor LprI family protein [Luteimonas fraxinea]|uniref:lysozyme inhibitor LprI family protein n=1 Tax=Luteimonas fraxinea TaxID=2901869 RepID=UPI001E47F89F|nr:lysozyme inhibitor LprI family protein [Luteimonas fraxinea]MCD9126925.1 lysozyme inhibitor LprI family protein [Luteimonas fraxinea]
MSNPFRTVFPVVLLAFAMTHATSAVADDASAGFTRCMDAAEGVTVDMLNCIDAETSLQDARLNSEYRRTLAAITTRQQARLRTAQRLWVQYRDANCAFLADPEGGTLATVMSVDCRRQMTTERASELARLRNQTRVS